MAAELSLEVPGEDEYLALRSAAGLSTMTSAGARLGLPASWCSVCLRDDGELVLGLPAR